MSDDNTKKLIKLTTEPYKGVRDFYPQDQFIQNYIFSKMRKVAESFGYNEYEASVLEPAELYRAKTGEEIVNEQTYTFQDRGDRAVTLRPEMTPTVARMVAARKQELAFPLRWYSIPNLFRYEKPQRGRVREHWQLNVDLFGVSNLEAEIEVISMASAIMKEFGLKDSDFEIRINSRALLQGMDPKAIKLLDKKDKMDKEEFRAAWKEVSDKDIEADFEANDEIKTLIKRLAGMGIKNVKYNPAVVRGFDYYTGIVFEVFDKNPKNSRSIFGGGRYDDLLSIFGGTKIPAVGFGMGDVVIRDILETYNLLPEYRSEAQLYVCVMDKTLYEFAQEIAQKLRKNNISVAIDFSGKKIGDQIKTADKQKIPYIVCIGEDEKKSNEFKVKNLKSGEEKAVTLEKIPSVINS